MIIPHVQAPLFVMWLGERITEAGSWATALVTHHGGHPGPLPQNFVQEVVGRMGPAVAAWCVL
jgi:hypothetical protein